MTLARAIAMFSRLLAIMLVAGWAIAAPFSTAVAQGEATPNVSGVTTTVENQFPQGMHMSVQVQATDVTEAALYYRVAQDETLNLVVVPPANITANPDGTEFQAFIDFQLDYLPPGVTISWFWEYSTGEGEPGRTAEETGQWRDTRFEWDMLESDQVELYTYDASDEFASWMLEESQATIDDLEQRYGLDEIEPVSIWIYPDYDGFTATMQANTRESVAGMSYPGASVILAIVPDGNEREFGRVILHEISHQVLFHATENPFGYPPLWLDEGLATHYQTGGTDHYPGMVWRAAEADTLFDITSLNASFPFQPAQATLAYASSWSMVEYIESTYGAEGIARLIDAFGDGLPADKAIEEALGVPAQQLNSDWHSWIIDQGDPGN